MTETIEIEWDEYEVEYEIHPADYQRFGAWGRCCTQPAELEIIDITPEPDEETQKRIEERIWGEIWKCDTLKNQLN